MFNISILFNTSWCGFIVQINISLAQVLIRNNAFIHLLLKCRSESPFIAKERKYLSCYSPDEVLLTDLTCNQHSCIVWIALKVLFIREHYTLLDIVIVSSMSNQKRCKMEENYMTFEKKGKTWCRKRQKFQFNSLSRDGKRWPQRPRRVC